MSIKRLQELEIAMSEINDIRNDIIGRQGLNWSAHIYPLVAILNRCGFEGMSYGEAKEMVERKREESLKMLGIQSGQEPGR